MIAEERPWDNNPSTTQLINGTMYSFLKLTKDYCIKPHSKAFMIAGTIHHKSLENMAKELGLSSEIALNIDRDVIDLLEFEDGELVLTDYKLWGSYKVAKVLGLTQIGTEPTGEVYKKAGYWGKVGDPKMKPVFGRDASLAENTDAELQLNHYRIMLKEMGITIKRMQVQATVRDGELDIAIGRGVIEPIYLIDVKELDDNYVKEYFEFKKSELLTAMEQDFWDEPCSNSECWDGRKCDKKYCDVWNFCSRGIIANGGQQ
jgi:hypothetical protein